MNNEKEIFEKKIANFSLSEYSIFCFFWNWFARGNNPNTHLLLFKNISDYILSYFFTIKVIIFF